MSVRRALLAACLLIAAGCSTTPTGPTTPTPPATPDPVDTAPVLSAERYLLRISGADFRGSPDAGGGLGTPWCQPPLVPRAGKEVTTFVWFSREGGELVGRSRAPYDSTLEIRLRRSAAAADGVAGVVTGRAADEYDRIRGKRDSAFAVAPGQAAVVDGRVSAAGSASPSVEGELAGAVSFGDTSGAMATCPSVSYALQVLPPGGPDDDPTLPPLVPDLRGAVGAAAHRAWSPGPNPRLVQERAWPWNRPISLAISRIADLAPRLLLERP